MILDTTEKHSYIDFFKKITIFGNFEKKNWKITILDPFFAKNDPKKPKKAQNSEKARWHDRRRHVDGPFGDSSWFRHRDLIWLISGMWKKIRGFSNKNPKNFDFDLFSKEKIFFKNFFRALKGQNWIKIL